MEKFKPLLADPVDFDKLQFPCVVSPKLDGIRAVNLGEGLVSRNMKPIKNKFTQQLFGGSEFKFFDGELIVGDPTAKDCYGVTNSGVMSVEGQPKVTYYVFDHFEHPNAEFHVRFDFLLERTHEMNIPELIKVVPHQLVESMDDLLAVETTYLQQGYEGLMIRSRTGRYKFGRSTAKEGILLKLKRFVDNDAVIIGFEELLSNQNEAGTDALGRTERSSHKDGMVQMDTLGALQVKDTETGILFNIGTGFTAEMRKDIWMNRDKYMGQMLKYKSFQIGVKDKPRFPVFLGWRSDL